MVKIFSSCERHGDTNVQIVSRLTDDCLLVRCTNAGGCPMSLIFDDHGNELYSCVSAHEEAMLKHFGFQLQGGAHA